MYTQGSGVVRLHVKEGYFFTPPKRDTSSTWGPPLPCKQTLKLAGIALKRPKMLRKHHKFRQGKKF